MDIKEQLFALNKMSKKSVARYHKFARSIGVSDSALGILYALLDVEACSQYDLCNEWSIPKQTINSAVDALHGKGYISISPISDSRNRKSISLTDIGREFAQKTVGVLYNAELDALAELDDEQRDTYIRLNEKYNEASAEKLDALWKNLDLKEQLLHFDGGICE